VRVVRAFGREQHEKQKFGERNEAWREKNVNLNLMFARFWSLADFITIFQQVLVLYFGA